MTNQQWQQIERAAANCACGMLKERPLLLQALRTAGWPANPSTTAPEAQTMAQQALEELGRNRNYFPS